MTQNHWARVKSIVDEAVAQPAGHRQAFAEDVCKDDSELLSDVLAQIAAVESTGGFLDDTASHVVAAAPAAIVAPIDNSSSHQHSSRIRSQATPDRVGPYRILEHIGAGGMGDVYLAEQLEPVRRRVALKLIRMGLRGSEYLTRFEVERQALAMMAHPCIAQVFDAGTTDDGIPYFAMEYVAGLPITAHCDKRKASLDERLRLVMQACDAVQHAHQKGVLHRDLKPSNLLVGSDASPPSIKVIDFGVAKATNQRLTEQTLYTELGKIIGTPEYMSPEQADGFGHDVDTRTDVYSLGCVLYELLVGARPFDSSELRSGGFAELQRVIREVDPPRPSERWERLEESQELAAARSSSVAAWGRVLRGDLDWITMKALEKDPSRRYATASELRADLESYLRHEAVVARPPSSLYLIRKSLRRHRHAAAAVALVLVSLAGGVAWALAERDRAKERAEAAEMSRIDAEKARAELAARVEQLQAVVTSAIEGSAKARETYGPYSRQSLAVDNELGRVMFAAGEADWAQALLADAHRGAPAEYPTHSAMALVTRALINIDQGQYATAAMELEAAYETLRKNVNRAPAIEAAEHLVTCYEKWHRVYPQAGHDARVEHWLRELEALRGQRPRPTTQPSE